MKKTFSKKQPKASRRLMARQLEDFELRQELRDATKASAFHHGTNSTPRTDASQR